MGSDERETGAHEGSGSAAALLHESVERRDLGALLAAAAGLALSGCAFEGAGSMDNEELGVIVQAATGTSLAWVDSVVGDLAVKSSANLGGAIVVCAKNYASTLDGGGGMFYWDTGSVGDGGLTIVPSAGGGVWRRVVTRPINVKWFGARGDNSTNDTAAIAAAIQAIAVGDELYLPAGTYLTNASILNLHTARWRGPGIIKRGTDTFTVQPRHDSTNKLYVATTGNSANDGLSSSQPFARIQQAFDAMRRYGPSLSGTWRIQVAAGTYTNQPVEVQGLLSSDYIVVAGPSVAMDAEPSVFHDGTGSSALFGMMFTHNMMVRVENIKIRNWTATDASGVLAQQCTLLWCYNVHVDNCDDAGIYAAGASRLYVQGGEVQNCAKGIRAIHQCCFTIGQGGDGVHVHHCEYGLHLRNMSSGVVIGDTVIEDCTVYGVQLLHFAEARFTGTTITGNAIGLSVIRSDWFDDGSTISGNTSRNFENSQHQGELETELFEHLYDRGTQRHGWGGGDSWFSPSTKYHFRGEEVSGGNFNAAARMGLEATVPVFAFLADGSGTNFSGHYYGKVGATAIGQLVYRYDDNSFRVIQNSVATYRFETGGFRPNADNTQALGLVGSRWAELWVNNVRANATGVAFNGTAPIAKPHVTGSCGSNPALVNLLAALKNLGLITYDTCV
jgi:hypothetical protein